MEQNSRYEIERKYLVRMRPANLESYGHSVIAQGYISSPASGATVRLRQHGERYMLTIKGPGTASRVEEEIEIDERQFWSLWHLTEGARLEKTRYYIPFGCHTVEFDVFRGNLEGLTLAEVEFNSVADAGGFDPPDWFGREVTEEGRYGNGSLARYGLPQGEE